MGRRALVWSGAVLVALILQQSAVQWFGPDANRWLAVALVVLIVLTVPAMLFGARVEGTSRWREARRRAMKHHRT